MCCGPWPHNMDPIANVHIGPSVGDWPQNEMMASAQLVFWLTHENHQQKHLMSPCSSGTNRKNCSEFHQIERHPAGILQGPKRIALLSPSCPNKTPPHLRHAWQYNSLLVGSPLFV